MRRGLSVMSPELLAAACKASMPRRSKGCRACCRWWKFPAETGGGKAGVAVVAQSFWQAKQALAALPIVWSPGPNAKLSSADAFRELAAKLDSEAGFTYYHAGDMEAGKGAVKTVKAEYSAPYLAHATMEPINCTAQVKDGKVTLWVPTQAASFAVDALAAKIAGVKPDQVGITVTYLGGGFGRRGDIDMVRQAVTIATVTKGAPVQLIWTREEDMTHDVYRPAALARFNATLDGAGNVLSYDNKSASDSVTQQFLARNFGLPGAGPDKTTAEGEFDMPYEFPNQRIAHVIVPGAVLPRSFGARWGTRITRFSRKALSTNWRMKQARIRSNSGAVC